MVAQRTALVLALVAALLRPAAAQCDSLIGSTVTGYDLTGIVETNLDAASFDVTGLACATGYTADPGTPGAVAAACARGTGQPVLSGCTVCGTAQAGCATSGPNCIAVGGVQVLECDLVDDGYFYDAGLGGTAASVAACPIGTYSDDRSGVTNTWALVSTSDTAATGHSCLGCAPGTYVTTTGSSAAGCINCAAGTFSAEDNNPATSLPCTACPTSAITAAVGSTAVTDCLCDVGFLGTIATASVTCTTIAGGTADCSGADACGASSGVFTAGCETTTTVTDTCVACAAGTEKLAAGTGLCIDCAAGSVDEDSSAITTCTACSAGEYSAAAAITCTACVAGTFDHDSLAGTACQDCAAGTYSLTDGLVSCDSCTANSGTGTTAGSSAVSACQCDLGYTGTVVDATSSCTACGAGQYIDVAGGADPTACIACIAGKTVTAAASTDISACVDIDECASNPCVNGAACAESVSDAALALDGYQCTCVDGYASGNCAYTEIVAAYTAECAVGFSTDAGLAAGAGNCAVDVDECTSTPCQNSAVCHEQVSAWTCQCATVTNAITGNRDSHIGEACDFPADPCDLDEDDCDHINAVCAHTGPGLHTCTCNLGWAGDGLTCADIDECSSTPCQHGGGCTESACADSIGPSGVACNAGVDTCVTTVVLACDAVVGPDAPTCAAAGATATTCAFTDATTGGAAATCTTSVVAACLTANADQATCSAAGACTFTAGDARPPTDSYRCACVDGFADGGCAAGWDADATLAAQYGANCQLDTGGTCSIDMDECLSTPCQNAAVCTDSTTEATVSSDTYQCTCAAGWGNGVCEYSFITEYTTQCNVMESDDNPVPACDAVVGPDATTCAAAGACTFTAATAGGGTGGAGGGTAGGRRQLQATAATCTTALGGNCDLDVNECDSNPCQNAAVCSDSTTEAAVSLHTYQCTCVAGWGNGVCEYTFISQYNSQCNVMESDDDRLLTGNCDLDINECDSSPCQNGAVCSDSTTENAVSLHTYKCTCAPGYSNGVCAYSFITEYTAQCSVLESDDNPTDATLGGNCDIDNNECDSNPCQNAAVCSDSVTEPAVSIHTYQCTCAAGWGNGVCEYAFITEYANECAVMESTTTPGACATTDVPVCDAVVGPDVTTCAAAGGLRVSEGCTVTAGTALEEAAAATTCTLTGVDAAANPAVVGSCAVAAGSGSCAYVAPVDACAFTPGVTAATAADATCIGPVWTGTGWDGCAANPAWANGDQSVGTCATGDGCVYTAVVVEVTEVLAVCTTDVVVECDTATADLVACSAAGSCTFTADATLGGNCDIDINECDSNPCQNGAACTDSTTDPAVSKHTYQCTCVPGFANGVCGYTYFTTGWPFSESNGDYTARCSVMESDDNPTDATLGGNCDMDVNECDSSPCQNGAVCSDSVTEPAVADTGPTGPPAVVGVSVHAYQCTCTAGYANGVCEYSFITEYNTQCSVIESDDNPTDATLSGNCDIDVNECDSSPCQNGAACSDSVSDAAAGLTTVTAVHTYSCLCALGFVNGQCSPDTAACTTTCLDTYDTQCAVPEPTSLSTGNCDVDVDECASDPCQHEGTCSGLNALAGYQCTCPDYALGLTDLTGQTTVTASWLAGQAGISSTWMPSADCEVREYQDYRCEPGQEVNTTTGGAGVVRGGETETYNCNECQGQKGTVGWPDYEPPTYSAGGLTCEVCQYPDVVIPVPWWCRRQVDSTGTVIQAAGPCMRNLACTHCPTGLVPNNSSSACVEPDLSGDPNADTASSTVAAVVPTAQVIITVNDNVFSGLPSHDSALEALIASLVSNLAVAMIVLEGDIIVEGLTPVEAGGRRLQNETWRAPNGVGTMAQLIFTIRAGSGAGALYSLDSALTDPTHPTAVVLEGLGMQTDTFEVGARCPAGKTRTGDDTTCYKCPFPKFTTDRETCIACPEGQEPSDKGDECRCGDGFYNSTTGNVNCYTLYETYVPAWDFADKSKQFDSTPGDQCTPCPEGGGADSCVSCVGGVVRMKSGYGLGDSDQRQSSLPIDVIAGPRPVFECLIKSQCFGDEGLNGTTPDLGAPVQEPTWENTKKCSEANLNGKESTCTSRGDCIYTPGLIDAPAAADATLATTYQKEACVGRIPTMGDSWCSTGYEGPLCSNCGDGYSRGGIKRESPCFECPDGVPRWAWAVLFLSVIIGLIVLEFIVNRQKEEEEEDDIRPMADRAVALVIGNGDYEVWPDVTDAPFGSNRVAEQLSGYGYRVIHVNNANQDTFEKAVSQYQSAVGEMAAVSVEAKRTKACGVQEDSTAEDELLKQLSALTLKELRARAMDDGANPVELEDLLHMDNPTEATIAFCMEKEYTKILEAQDADAPEEEKLRPWILTEQRQLEASFRSYFTQDEQFAVDVPNGDATDKEWQNYRDEKWTTIAEGVEGRNAGEVKARVKRIGGKSQLLNPPGMADGEVACMVYFCGHGCQIEGKNFLVPADANLNPTSTNLISVEDVLQARCGDKETQERIGETVSGPSIVVLDAARWLAPGSLDQEHLDTFKCPITKKVMTEPVYLMGEPKGWRYEKVAVQAYLDGMKEKKADYRSPMSAKKLLMPNTIPPKLTGKTVLDTKLQHRIVKYVERSTLNQMEPVVENTILVFSARPNMYADREGKLFTEQLLMLMAGNDPVGMLFTKASIRTLRESQGEQVCWDFNAMTQIGTFCISGKVPIPQVADEDIDPEEEGLMSILQQSESQAQQTKGAGTQSSPNSDTSICSKPKMIFGTANKLMSKIKPSLKTFVGMMQILGGMSFAFNIEWPTIFNQIVEYSKALSIDFAAIIPIGCFTTEWTFTQNFYMQVSYPPFVLIAMLSIHKVRALGLREQVDPPDKEIQFEHEELVASSLGYCFTFVFMIYPAVSQCIFQALISQDLAEGESLLRVDFQVDYESDTHQVLIVVAVLMVLVYPLGFPLSIAGVLYQNRAGLLRDESAERQQFAPLVEDYRNDCYYWEALEMFRKIMLTGLLIFFSPGSIFQLVLGLMVSAVFLVLSVRTQPFTSRFNNRFKVATDVAIMTTFCVAVLMNKHVDSSQEPTWMSRSLFDAVFAVINIWVPMMVVAVELFTQAAEDDDEEVHEYAWLGDENSGGFKELDLDEDPRMKSLRYKLENVDLKLLNELAGSAGVGPKTLQSIHSSDHPKQDIINALMEIARMEGDEKGQKSKGTVAKVFGFSTPVEKMESEDGKSSPNRKSGKKGKAKKGGMESEFDNPLAGNESEDFSTPKKGEKADGDVMDT